MSRIAHPITQALYRAAFVATAASLASGPVAATTPAEPSASVHDQVAAERLALRLIQRPDVQAALGPLAQEWQAGTQGLLRETYRQIPESIRELALLTALQTIASDPRRPKVIEISAPPHRWYGLDVPGGRWGINNPDTLYFLVPVEPGSTYVVTGQRHSRGPIDANYSLQTSDGWVTLANIGYDDLQVGDDGRYRITIDDQPALGRRNHIQIRDGAHFLLIRNTLGDWANELPDTLTVERVAGPAAGPVPTDDALAAQIIERLRATVRRSIAELQPPILKRPANSIPQPGAVADKPGFLVTQRNALGHFRITDDEAIIATVNPGGARYATFPVTSIWGITPDPRQYQNSLNATQAVPNADGTITVILSNRDPGVANWINAGGLHEGIVMLRWQRLAAVDPARGGPAVEAKLIRFADLPALLPKGTTLFAPAERVARQTERARTFERRFTER